MVALPLVFSNALLRAITKPRPGTPSMHLFDDAATASNVMLFASSGSAPNALMESIRKRLPWRAAISPILPIGLRMPDVVSQ